VSTVLIVILALLVVAVAVLAVMRFRPSPERPRAAANGRTTRILFPFTAEWLSSRALDAALRLARAENATLVPVFLARVPLRLPLDTPLPRQSKVAMPMLDAIEQRAAKFDVPVDARVERGRSYKHAMRQTIGHERFDRIVVAASGHSQPGFSADDVGWLIDAAPGELLIVRPDPKSELALPPIERKLGLPGRSGSRASAGGRREQALRA
jgi:nucleotide-binding universal stress UspA family protein